MKNDPWQKLAADARQAAPDATPDEPIPFGLTTRVLAAWREHRRELDWERVGWGALASALAVATICVVLNYHNLQGWRSDDLNPAAVSEVETLL